MARTRFWHLLTSALNISATQLLTTFRSYSEFVLKASLAGDCSRFITDNSNADDKQEAFEKCWAHSPQRAAARHITIHQVSLLSRRTPPMSTTTTMTTTTTRDRGDRYGPMEWAQSGDERNTYVKRRRTEHRQTRREVMARTYIECLRLEVVALLRGMRGSR